MANMDSEENPESQPKPESKPESELKLGKEMTEEEYHRHAVERIAGLHENQKMTCRTLPDCRKRFSL